MGKLQKVQPQEMRIPGGRRRKEAEREGEKVEGERGKKGEREGKHRGNI